MKTENKTVIQPGHFIMRDRSFQASSPAGQEIGIVLNNDYYVDIDFILTTPVSREEAQRYSKKLKLNLPSKKLMHLLTDNQETINKSLLSIGRGDCLLLGDLTQQFWTQHPDDCANTKRSVVFIVPVRKH